jgi:hypothetical protein
VVDAVGKRLVEACVAGDAAARQQFQDRFLPLIHRVACSDEIDSADQDFVTFAFEDDRIYRRARSFEGRAPLDAYMRVAVVPDLLKQFRKMVRRERLLTISLDAAPESGASLGGTDSPSPEEASPTNAATDLLAPLALEKRVLMKLLYIEDFDLDPKEIQLLAARTGRTIREVIESIENARAHVRSREAVQHDRFDAADSSGQWVRLCEHRLARLEEDLRAFDPDSPRGLRLRRMRADLWRKIDRRREQQRTRLHDAAHTVVTLPTKIVAQLLGQRESATRAQITRIRQELAALHAGRRNSRSGSEQHP